MRTKATPRRAPPASEPISKPRPPNYTLRLYICDMTPRSSVAVDSVRQICREHLRGRHHLEVIDIYQHPELARSEQIVGVPTLIKISPLPQKRLLGDMRDHVQVCAALDLQSVAVV